MLLFKHSRLHIGFSYNMLGINGMCYIPQACITCKQFTGSCLFSFSLLIKISVWPWISRSFLKCNKHKQRAPKWGTALWFLVWGFLWVFFLLKLKSRKVLRVQTFQQISNNKPGGPLAVVDEASSCCCLPFMWLLQTFWFSHGNPLRVTQLPVRGIRSPQGFSARHPAPWHCLGGSEPQCHPHTSFQSPLLITQPSSLHQGVPTQDGPSCSSLPSSIPLSLLPASYSLLLSCPFMELIFFWAGPTTPPVIPETSHMRPRTAVLYALLFLYPVWSSNSCPPHPDRLRAPWAQSCVRAGPSTTPLHPLLAISPLLH